MVKKYLFALCVLAPSAVPAFAQAPVNVQKSTATATRNDITGDLDIAAARTLTIESGGTLTVSGTLGGTPSGGTLDLTNVTFTPSANVVTLTGTQTLTNKTLNLTSNTLVATSAQLLAALTDETGTGAAVFANSPTLVTPALGTPSSATLTNATGLPIATGVSGLGTGIATALAVNTGSAGAPVLFNGALGAPSSGTLTNATGLPIDGGTTGTLPVARGGTGTTTSTGTGSVVLSASPTFTGTPAAPTAAEGTSTTQLATTAFVRTAVDTATQALDLKASVRAISTTNLTLSGTQTVDGVALVAGDRILVAGQTTGSQNGIYVVAAGAWTRATDADTSADVTTGMFAFVSEGTAAGSNGYVLTTPEPIVLGTTSLTYTQFSGAGQIIAGTGLAKSGNTLSTSAIPNASLANSAITIAGTSTSLGGSITLDTITGLSTTGLVKRTAANTLAIATAATDYVAPSAYASANGLTMATARLLGRTTAGTGAAEEISIGGNLTLSAGTLNISSSYAGQSTITTTGALNSGSITSGFSSIDVGADSITGGAISGTVFTATTASATDRGYDIRQSGDTNARLIVRADGRIWWGGGTGTFLAYIAPNGSGLDIAPNGSVVGAFSTTGLAVTGIITGSSTIQTAAGVAWNLGAYTAGAPTPDGYLTVTVAGSTYRLSADLQP